MYGAFVSTLIITLAIHKPTRSYLYMCSKWELQMVTEQGTSAQLPYTRNEASLTWNDAITLEGTPPLQMAILTGLMFQMLRYSVTLSLSSEVVHSYHVCG